VHTYDQICCIPGIRIPVPVAVVVCEGDIVTIAHVRKALKRKLPVVVVKGSGKAADLIVDYVEKYGKLFLPRSIASNCLHFRQMMHETGIM
jgi:hypothetical protein